MFPHASWMEGQQEQSPTVSSKRGYSTFEERNREERHEQAVRK